LVFCAEAEGRDRRRFDTPSEMSKLTVTIIDVLGMLVPGVVMLFGFIDHYLALVALRQR
jgi:hypothetical protein